VKDVDDTSISASSLIQRSITISFNLLNLTFGIIVYDLDFGEACSTEIPHEKERVAMEECEW
jgi:hypothetical protein